MCTTSDRVNNRVAAIASSHAGLLRIRSLTTSIRPAAARILHSNSTACSRVRWCRKSELTTQSDADPDVAITATMLSLARLAANGDAASAAAVDFSGDIEKAQDFQRLLEYAKPDAEEQLAGVLGDAAAHRLGEFARSVSRWARGARATMGDNVREYLQE